MVKKRNLLISKWNKHQIYLIPTIRIGTSWCKHKRLGFTIFFLGWQLFYTRYEEWTGEDFKNHLESIKNESKTVQS